jgi:hypothetical protein
MVDTAFARFVAAALILWNLSSAGHARPVEAVVIEKVGQIVDSYKNDRDPIVTEGCKLFRPTVKQVALFFSKAYPVPLVVRNHERYSPCYATGTIRFGGRYSGYSFGTWTLYSSGTASVNWAFGGGFDAYHMPNKWYDPLAGGYGLGDDGED